MLFLSAGHHPAAPGAAWKGLVEHTEAVRWVRELSQFLPEAIVVPTGNLTHKINFINARAASNDLAIDIHFNAASKPTARGSETLYNPGSTRGRNIADDVQAVLAKHFPPNRGIKLGYLQTDPAKGPLAFLSRTRCTALIIEPEFIYHADSIRAGMIPCCADLAAVLKEYTP
jgi:N-acetylmuramoyl-L-alanine amidase